MNKACTFNYQGINQDVAQGLFKNTFYYDAHNVRIVATDTQATGAVSNERGNKFIYALPTPVINYSAKTITYAGKTLEYTTSEIDAMAPGQPGQQFIIGSITTRKYAIIFSSDEAGFDCIWRINIDQPGYDITLLYMRNLLFSRNFPIQALNNFENEIIDKVYWVDGRHQIRFINIEHSIANEDLENLIDVSKSTIDMVGEYDISQPIISRILTGGSHTAGMIQYAYNLYRVNASQTKLSPLSQLVALDKGVLGGGELNEVVGSTPVVDINNIDPDYTHIRVYAIKYTSYNQTPTIGIIEDREIPSSRAIEIFDDGSVIGSLSLTEFLFLGSDIVIPKHINSKENRLFMANYEERNYNVDLDLRAYSFKSDGTSIVYDNIKKCASGDPYPCINGITGEPRTIIPPSFGPDNPEDKFDSINLDYDTYRFQLNGTTYGGEGKYLKYELYQTDVFNPDSRYLKDDEIYRLGIEFINSFGQYSLPIWVADFKAREGNLRGKYNALIITLKPAFFTWLNDPTKFPTEYDKPVGYRTLLAERTVNDKTIVANGLVSPTMINDKNQKDVQYPADAIYVRDRADSIPKMPNILVRNIGPKFTDFSRHFGSNTRPLELAQNLQQMARERNTPDTEINRAYKGNRDTLARSYQYNAMYQMYSPEILFGHSIQLSANYEFRMKGGLENKYNTVWGKTYEGGGNVVHDEGKGLNGVSLTYADTRQTITGNGEDTTDDGLVSHPNQHFSDRVPVVSRYRGYGNVSINEPTNPNSHLVSFNVPFILTLVPPSPPMPTIPPYPVEAIRFASNNRDIVMTANQNNRKFVLTYTLTPVALDASKPYKVSICTDSQGANEIETFSGFGSHVISLSPANQTYPNPGALYKGYDFFLKIAPDFDDILFDIDIHAEIQDADTSAVLVAVDSLDNSVIATIAAPSPATDAFKVSTTKKLYPIYGVPELTVRGQNLTSYNKDSKYKYVNTFIDLLTDKNSNWDNDGTFGRSIISGNCDGQKCITFVLDKPTPVTNWYDRPMAEDLYAESNFAAGITNLGIVGEIVIPRDQIYLGNVYGGNSWEDKKRTKYIEIGDYQELNSATPNNLIISPGDTFVNYFRFLRVVPKLPVTFTEGVATWQEIVEVFIETTVDLKNRNDKSFNTWDSAFMYLDDDYHKYNKVYSQLPNLLSKKDLDFNVKKVNGFDTNVIASRKKSAGEIIDSWTDMLPNEVITLDGKYGAINSLISFNDNIFTIQDKALAFLSINPRVQVQGGDGIGIELGTGEVLDKYKYITTDSGTLNKWGVAVSSSGVYFYDTLNQSFNVFKNTVEGLSDVKGLHTFFIKNILPNDIKQDNPLLHHGIACAYDYINNDVLFTFHQSLGKSFTLAYNENIQAFSSFYDYIPTMYISKGSVLIAIDPTDLLLYRQYEGKYNEFFGTKYKSSITFNVNPEPVLDCVFDNINFKSEVYDTNTKLDVPDKTLSHIRAYNDYQDSGLFPLISGRNNNLRRKFRDWNALIPKEGRNRIRAPWIKLEVDFDQLYNNPNNLDYKFILHPVNVYYTI